MAWLQLAAAVIHLINRHGSSEFDFLDDEQVLRQADANRIENHVLSSPGVMCLTNRRLRWQYGDEYISYPLDAIIGIKLVNVLRVVPRGIEFEFVDGRKELFVVDERELWIAKILKAKAIFGEQETFERASDGTLLDAYKVSLRKTLSTHFNESELQTLCFDLSIDYENLEGNTKDEKARELVIYCQRNGLLPKLLLQCQQVRPNVVWL
jgi:hypothetical protein